jgi:hypothetical protein
MSDPNQHSNHPLPETAPDTAIIVDGVDYDRHDARSGIIAAVSISILVLLVVMIVGVYWLYTVAYEKVEYDQYTGVASKELQAIQAREDEQLHKYAYIDKEKGVIRLPIDRAMAIVEAEYAEGKAGYNTKSYPVKVELPGGAAGGANPPLAGQPGAPAAQPAATTAPPAASHK